MTTIPTEAIGNNIDLLTEILLRLPVKPLVRFKCISKQLLSLISDPQFCFSHTRHHHQHQSQYPTPTALLLKKAFDYTPEFEIIPIKHDTVPPKVPSFGYLNAAASGFHIRQSCNGLFLCSTSYVTRLEFEVEHIYYVCNPTTKHFKRLSPPACKLFKESLLSKVCMAFDPLKSNHYKLIDVRRVIKTTNKYHIDMYSSGTDSWSTSRITFTPPNLVDFSNPVFCNGAVHWYSKGKTSLYFDVDRECLNTMPMPKLGERVVQYFGESRGHLHLVLTEWCSPSQFDVLEMAADYSGWFVRYHVNLDDAVRIQFPEIQNRFSVLHVVRAQKEEESIIVVLNGDDNIISYNFHDGTSKKLYDLERGGTCKSYYTWRNSFQYFESLISV